MPIAAGLCRWRARAVFEIAVPLDRTHAEHPWGVLVFRTVTAETLPYDRATLRGSIEILRGFGFGQVSPQKGHAGTGHS